eukprot:jgi/Chlat1/39/ChrspC234687S00920
MAAWATSCRMLMLCVLCWLWTIAHAARRAPLSAAETDGEPRQPLPFVVMHGLGDQCNIPASAHFVKQLAEHTGATGMCIEVGSGALDSWFMPIDKQVEIMCEKVKASPVLKDGFNILGFSQGNLIARGIIQWCEDAPKVHNFISLGGPHAGTASVPFCGSPLVCALIDRLIKLELYSAYVQDHLGPAGYVKDPLAIAAYQKGCRFLPYLNNEFSHDKSRGSIASLNLLVLVKFNEDTVLDPPETAWFGFYEEGTRTRTLAPNETELYREDWVGLQQLDKAGRVAYISSPGQHLHITTLLYDSVIVPALSLE